MTTPLSGAILANNSAVVEMILDRKVKPKDERKILEAAAIWDKYGVLALIFQRGVISRPPLERSADLLHQIKSNETPLLFAVNWNFNAGIKLLLEAIVSPKGVSREKLAQDVHSNLTFAIHDVRWGAEKVLQIP